MNTPAVPVRPRGMPLFAGFRLHMADDWRRLHTRGVVIYTGALGAISALGPELRDAWRSMPDDLKAVVPAHVQQGIAYAILFATIIGVRYTTVRREPPPGQQQGGGDGSQ